MFEELDKMIFKVCEEEEYALEEVFDMPSNNELNVRRAEELEIEDIQQNIEKAALQELAEVLRDYNEESMAKFFGKDVKDKFLSAKSVQEKLESLRLTVMRVFVDRIEMKCHCDWYKYGGGFIIIENGECLMRPIDSLSF